MREKLAIANKMRISRKNYSNNPEYQQICSKCYRAYIVECILKGKDEFQISYGSKYVLSTSRRIANWCKYFINIIYRFLLISLTLNDEKFQRKYELIHFGVPKPIHLKLAEIPDEIFLYKFLEENGFKVVDEHINGDSIVYNVTRA